MQLYTCLYTHSCIRSQLARICMYAHTYTVIAVLYMNVLFLKILLTKLKHAIQRVQFTLMQQPCHQVVTRLIQCQKQYYHRVWHGFYNNYFNKVKITMLITMPYQSRFFYIDGTYNTWHMYALWTWCQYRDFYYTIQLIHRVVCGAFFLGQYE